METRGLKEADINRTPAKGNNRCIGQRQRKKKKHNENGNEKRVVGGGIPS